MGTIPNRGAIRARWVALVEAEGDWQAVYDHQPKTFGSQSPVATVHSGAVQQEADTFDEGQDVDVEILHTNYVKRDDADAAEDVLDDLLQVVGALVKEHHKDTSGNWQELRIERTEPDYFLVDGEHYRAEVIRVIATVYV